MPGQIVHFEIPADDTAKGREFWGSLFGWQFEASPGPFEYHMACMSDQAGLAINQYGARQARHACRLRRGRHQRRCPAREGARGRGRRAGPVPGMGWFVTLQGSAGERVRPLAKRPVSVR
jgi:hypothetical protein